MSVVRATGLRREVKRAGARFANVRTLRKRLAGASGGGADLRPYTGGVLDQGSVGSCVFHAVPGAVCTSLAAAGKPLGFTPSVCFGYTLCLRLDRASDHPGVRVDRLPAIRDRGTRIATAVDVVERYGLGPGGSDCPPGAVESADSRLVSDAIRAAVHVHAGAYELFTKDDLMMALDAGASCVIGGYVDRVYMAYGPRSEPLGRPDYSDAAGGGHATELLGYRWAAGVRLWLIKGSWGTGWGLAGYGWLTDDYVDHAWAIYAMMGAP